MSNYRHVDLDGDSLAVSEGELGAVFWPATSEAFQTQPDLDIFRARGWFIAEKVGDKCPACVERTVKP